jgi:hypothetical protein
MLTLNHPSLSLLPYNHQRGSSLPRSHPAGPRRAAAGAKTRAGLQAFYFNNADLTGNVAGDEDSKWYTYNNPSLPLNCMGGSEQGCP